MIQVLGIDLGTTNSDMAIIGFKILTIVMVSKRQLMVQIFLGTDYSDINYGRF